MKTRSVRVIAPAKVNLTLHVTGKRDDGYHELDSLVAFARVCDRLFVQDGNVLSLTVEGPEAKGVPADMKNLALQAAAIYADDGGDGASLLLEKHLPAAAGIGGGSADAAAAIRAMLIRSESVAAEDWQMPSDAELAPRAGEILKLGADVPMCLLSKTCRARGIGEKLDFVTLPSLWGLLVNPRVAVATPDVFKTLSTVENPPMPDAIPDFGSAAELTDWLATQRNDLEAAAIDVAPVISNVLNELRQTPGCQLARMSGSGATCFAIFPDEETTIAAEAAVKLAHPGWWTAAGALGDMSLQAMPIYDR